MGPTQNIHVRLSRRLRHRQSRPPRRRMEPACPPPIERGERGPFGGGQPRQAMRIAVAELY